MSISGPTRKVVLLLTVAANLMMVVFSMAQILGRPDALMIIINYAGSFLLYVALIVPAAFARKPRLFAILVGLHVAIYIAIACMPAGFGVPPPAKATAAATAKG